MYEAVLKEAIVLWQKPGDGLEQAIRFLRSHVASTEGELRGRILSLMGEFLLNAGDKTEAFAAHVEALTLITSPSARVVVLVACINACIPLMKVAQGLRFRDECETLLNAPTYVDADGWRAKFHRNVGELLMRAGDHEEAVAHLRNAVGEFERQGKHQEALRSQVDLAECLMLSGDLETALSICRGVRLDNACSYVLFKLNVVQGRVAVRMKKTEDAERLLDQAYVALGGKLSEQDRLTLVELECAKVEVALAKGDEVGADALRRCAKRVSASLGLVYGS